MRLHHATVKRAEDHGVTLTVNEDQETVTGTKGPISLTTSDPKSLIDAVAFAASCAANYPALLIAVDPSGNWTIHHRSDMSEPIWQNDRAPTNADLDDIGIACDERELDIEEGFSDDEDERGGSIVDPAYKRQYAEDGHPNNNGDWMADVLDGQNGHTAIMPKILKAGSAKRLIADVERYYVLFTDNGITVEDQNFSNAYFHRRPRNNGWEGQFAMGGRNMLRKKIADAGVLIAFGERIEVPEDFVARWRTKPKKKSAKALKAEAEAAEEQGA